MLCALRAAATVLCGRGMMCACVGLLFVVAPVSIDPVHQPRASGALSKIDHQSIDSKSL